MDYLKIGKFIVIFVISILSIGCASLEARQVSKGDYAEAFRNFLYSNDNRPDDSKARNFTQSIKDKAGSNLNNEFLIKSLELLNIHGDSEYSVVQFMDYIDYAHKYGLLTEYGKNKLTDSTYIAAGKVWAKAKNPLSENFNKTFPDLQIYVPLALADLYDSAFIGSYLPYDTLIKIYKNEIGKSEERANALIGPMLERIKTAREKSDTDTPISQFIDSYELTKNKNLKLEIIECIKKGFFSKAEIESIRNSEFTNLASDVLNIMNTQISIEGDSNESLIDEIIGKIQYADEWISISEEALRKIKISRVRFSEKESNSGWRSQVLSNLNLATILFIPKNASVLVDLSTNKYEINWSLNIRDSINNKIKVISGKKNFYKNECANPRFRNVFGGEGALSYMPSEADICNQSNTTNFNKEREKVILEIVSDIVNFVNENSRSKLIEKNIN